MSKKLTEQINDLHTRAEAVLNAAKAEGRPLTEEEKEQVRGLKAQSDALRETLALEESVRSMGIEAAEQRREEAAGGEAETRSAEAADEAAFDNYVRGYRLHERAGELTKGDNGAVIPTTIANRIIKRVYDICPILQRSQRYSVKGNLDLPYYDTTTDSVTVAYQNEFTPLVSHSGKFLAIQLTGFLAGSLTKISRSLINNAQFNVTDFIVNDMAEGMRRFIEHELLLGTANKVEGLSTLAASLTAASQTAVTADELIELKDSVKDPFQSGACWIMSPTTRTAIRLLKDDVGRYLLTDDLTSPFGTVLLGKPVYVTDNMPDMAAGRKAIYYGDMTGLATKFNEQINIQVLRERFADEHAVGVVGWFEFDAKVQDAQKLACLKMKA